MPSLLSAMDPLFSSVLQQLHPNTLLIDKALSIRFASGLLADLKPGMFLPEVLPGFEWHRLSLCNTHLQGPVHMGQAGDFFFQVVPLVTAHFDGYGLVFQQQTDYLSLKQSHQHIQRLLYQAEKMAVIGQFTTSVTHEINNPIGYVYSNLHTLNEYVDSLISVIEALPAAATASQQLAIKQQFDYDFICNDIRNMLRESGFGLEQVLAQVAALKDLSHTDDLIFQLTDIQHGLLSCIHIVHNEVKYKAVIHQQLAPLPPIECIASQLYQVVLNLLVNAGQAISGRGEIFVRTGVEPAQIWVEVEDTGAGISAQHLSQIFEPFFTTKAVGKGTGLGLAISKNIIEQHHGRIEVTSTLDVGTKFKIWLPTTQPKPLPYR